MTPLELVFAGCLAATASAAVGAWILGKQGEPSSAEPDLGDDAVIYLFRGLKLVDCTRQGRDILAAAPEASNDWARVLAALAPHFPDIADRLDSLDETGRVEITSRDGVGILQASACGDAIRIVIRSPAAQEGGVRVDTAVYQSMTSELETLRMATDELPFPIWRQSPEGRVVWANRAYISAATSRARNGAADAWPPPILFEKEELDEVLRDGVARRLAICLRDASTEAQWFECRGTRLGPDVLFSAVGIDATMTAERQLREFMQTLTKTFSHLTTGLAVFDRQRKLALFNPALTDLTGLPVDFLAARPTLYSFLDRLRDKRMIPEPKDYGSWRRQIAELEAAASDGTYSETWSLPDSRTYRVTGRPHPGGAVAFLFEDISAEISLTRRFRSELELGQAVIDALDEALVVFAPDGTLSMMNRAYRDLWSTDIDTTLDLPSVTEMSRIWMARCSASPIWGDIRDFVLHGRERSNWEDSALFLDGQRLHCRILPLAGGSTLIGFSRADSSRPGRMALVAGG